MHNVEITRAATKQAGNHSPIFGVGLIDWLCPLQYLGVFATLPSCVRYLDKVRTSALFAMQFEHQSEPILGLALALGVIFVGWFLGVFSIFQNSHDFPIGALRAKKVEIVSHIRCALQPAMGDFLRAVIWSSVIELGHFIPPLSHA